VTLSSLPHRLVDAVRESPVSHVLDRVLTIVTGPFVPSDASLCETADRS
jgi:hypothetical protein